MKLLSSQKNALFELLRKRGFQPQDFEVIAKDLKLSALGFSSRITHKKTRGYYFSIIENLSPNLKGKYIVQYSPANENVDGKVVLNNFPQVHEQFNHWADYLLREIDADNIWEEWTNELKNEGIDFESTNYIPFTEEEKEEVREKISVLKIEIKGLNILPPPQLNVIEKKIDNLNEKLDKLDKSSWLMLCIGTFFTIATALTLSPEVGKRLWHLFLDFMTTRLKLK